MTYQIKLFKKMNNFNRPIKGSKPKLSVSPKAKAIAGQTQVGFSQLSKEALTPALLTVFY